MVAFQFEIIYNMKCAGVCLAYNAVNFNLT